MNSGYAEEGDDQKEIMSGSYPDISADCNSVLPNHDDIDGYHEPLAPHLQPQGQPNNLLCPRRTKRIRRFSSGASQDREGKLVFGQFSVANHEIREAINLSAWYPDIGWDPTSGTMPISPVCRAHKPVGD